MLPSSAGGPLAVGDFPVSMVADSSGVLVPGTRLEEEGGRELDGGCGGWGHPPRAHLLH